MTCVSIAGRRKVRKRPRGVHDSNDATSRQCLPISTSSAPKEALPCRSAALVACQRLVCPGPAPARSRSMVIARLLGGALYRSKDGSCIQRSPVHVHSPHQSRFGCRWRSRVRIDLVESKRKRAWSRPLELCTPFRIRPCWKYLLNTWDAVEMVEVSMMSTPFVRRHWC